MEFKKRKAELQLTQENVDEVEASYTESVIKKENESEIKGDDSESVPPAPATATTGGFSAYAKVNPFAAAIANNANKSAFGTTSAPTSFGSASAGRSSFTMPPPLVLPSPKSPKANPFSSPSPAHNPFMTIVQNNDDMWKSMANDKLSADEVAKTSVFIESKNRKSPVFRTSFFGGSGNGSTSFSSVTPNEGTSVFGSSNSNTTPTTSATTINSIFGGNSTTSITAIHGSGEDEDEVEGGAGEDDALDQQDSSPPANHASMKIISLPENVKLVTGEEDDECLLQMRAKIFRLHTKLPNIETPIVSNTIIKDNVECNVDTNTNSSSSTIDKMPMEASSVLNAVAQENKKNSQQPKAANAASTGKAGEWVEMGIGPLKILSRKANSSNSTAASGRIVMRREDKQGGLGTKLLLNAWMDRSLTASRQSDKMVQLICVNHAEVPVPAPAGTKVTATSKIGTYLIKTKTADEAEDICAIVSDFIARAKQTETPANTTGTSTSSTTNGNGNTTSTDEANTTTTCTTTVIESNTTTNNDSSN